MILSSEVGCLAQYVGCHAPAFALCMIINVSVSAEYIYIYNIHCAVDICRGFG